MYEKKNLYIVDCLIGENKEKSYSKKNIFKKNLSFQKRYCSFEKQFFHNFKK